MSNIDKQAKPELREKFERWWEVNFHNGNAPRHGWEYWRDGEGYSIEGDEEFQWRLETWQAAHSEKLEAAEMRIAELTESLKQTVSGYKSCLITGHERILDLGGDCDAPEVMIAGNPDIQQAEKLIAAAAGKGEAS